MRKLVSFFFFALAVCLFFGDVGGVGQHRQVGQAFDGSGRVEWRRQLRSVPMACFASLFAPPRLIAPKLGCTLSALVVEGKVPGLRQRSARGCRMVFLPPDWEKSPAREGDKDLDLDPFGKPPKVKQSPKTAPKEKFPVLDPWEKDRTDVIRSYSPIYGDMQSPEEVNEELRPTGLEKHRLKLKPDEAFGSIFRYEGALVDTIPIHKKAWTLVAQEMNLRIPDDDDIELAMAMPTEKAIQRIMHWTEDWGDTKRMAFRKAEAYYQCFQEHNHTLRDSTVEWLERLHKANIPMCLCTSMDSRSINSSVERMGLSHYFSAFVTAEDDVDTRAQMYLAAAIKLHRPPNFCVCFDNDPEGISAAHDISAQIVAVLGAHKAWELSTADLTVSSLDELSTYNIRRLFAERGEGRLEDQLELEREPERKTSRWSRGPWGGGYEDPDDPYVYSRGRN